jgi:hypothetical protein
MLNFIRHGWKSFTVRLVLHVVWFCTFAGLGILAAWRV